MSTIIKFDIKELKKLALDKNSCVTEKKVTQNLALQPWCLGNLRESIKNLLDYKIGKFDKEFNGILLTYKNLRVLQNIGAIKNDKADIHFQVQADYFIFQPHVGATLRGIVNKKSMTHLGVLVHRVFNVVIPRPTEEPGNKWIGTSVREGQHVIFRIVVLDLFGALPYIRGELDERCLNLGVEGDEDIIDMKPADDLTVTYVKFNRTKPHPQKEIGDGLLHSEDNDNLFNINCKIPNKNKVDHSVSLNNSTVIASGRNHIGEKNGDSENVTREKIKVKRQNKVQDATSPTETVARQTKRHKKDTM